MLDSRPDAALRYEIDYNTGLFFMWLEGKLQQTKTIGSGKNRKVEPKYKLSELLEPRHLIFDDNIDGFADGYNDDAGSVMTPGGLILPRKYRDPS